MDVILLREAEIKGLKVQREDMQEDKKDDRLEIDRLMMEHEDTAA